MKKIFVITPHFAPYRDDTFKLIEKKGFDFFFLITQGNVTHPEWEYKQYAFNFVKSKFYLTNKVKYLFFEYKKYLRKYNPDYIITSGDFLLILFTKIINRKVKIIMMTDQVKDGKNAHKFLNKLLLKKLYNLCDGIWTTCKLGEKYLSKYVSINKIKMGCYTSDTKKIIKNAISYNSVKERQELGIKEDEYVFLFVGKLIPTRKIENILHVAERCMLNHIKAKFLIVGDGPELFKLEKYQKKLNNIIHINKIRLDELEKVYIVSNGYLHLGWEPFSLALSEAAIIGLPIIANKNIGAVSMCLENEYNGFSFDEFNIDLIYKKCIKMIDGDYDKGAKEMSSFIYKHGGIKWAANQLLELLN